MAEIVSKRQLICVTLQISAGGTLESLALGYGQLVFPLDKRSSILVRPMIFSHREFSKSPARLDMPKDSMQLLANDFPSEAALESWKDRTAVEPSLPQ